MKKAGIFIILIMLTLKLAAQAVSSSPSAGELRDLSGKLVQFSDIIEPGHPLIITFWKTGNNACCENLETMHSVWMTRMREWGVRFIAVCEDCTGSWSHVKPVVAGKSWDFDVYIDVNGDFRRSVGIITIPGTVLYDAGMHLACKHPGWCSGNEDLICDKIAEYLTKEKQGLYSLTGASEN